MDLTKFGVEKKEESLKSVDDTSLSIEMDVIKKDYKQEFQEHFLPWFMKYQLSSFDDIIETKEIKKIREFFDKPPKDKGLLLVGPPGSGKTTTLQLFGETYNYEIFEMNASDTRNKSSISEVVTNVIHQKSLFNQEKLLLIDEVDGVSGTKDRGGIAEIIKLMKTSSYPFVFTANEKEANSIKSLKKSCIVVDFESHSYELLEKLSKRIFSKEEITFKEEELQQFIHERNTSDIRGFINDLQASVISGNFVLDTQSLEIRDYKQKIDQVLQKIFYSYADDALNSTRNSDVNLDDVMLYLEENIPLVYSKKATYLAFNELSKADVFKGRIMRWQYWRFLVYINFYLTYGVSSMKSDVTKVAFKRNSRILKKWIYGNKVNALRSRTRAEKSKNAQKRFIEILAQDLNTSAKRCRSRDLPYISFIFKKNESFRNNFIKTYDLDAATIKALDEM